METFKIVIITLLIYSAISTAVYLISRQNDEILCHFGLGIVGNILVFICYVIDKIHHFIKYYNIRSIMCIESTGELRYCKLKDTSDIYLYHKGYKLKKRYAKKEEWKTLKPFDQEFINYCKRNCSRCIHDDVECDSDRGICTDLDMFDKFIAK